MSSAIPGQAVRLVGLRNATEAGSTVLVAPSMDRAKAVFEKRKEEAYEKVHTAACVHQPKPQPQPQPQPCFNKSTFQAVGEVL